MVLDQSEQSRELFKALDVFSPPQYFACTYPAVRSRSSLPQPNDTIFYGIHSGSPITLPLRSAIENCCCLKVKLATNSSRSLQYLQGSV